MATRTWVPAIGLVTLLLGLPACTSGGDDTPAPAVLPSGPATSPPSAEPSGIVTQQSTPEPSPTVSAGAAELLSGKRQVEFVPVVGKEQTGGGRVMTVTSAGRADVAGGGGDRALFVPVKTRGDRYLIKTGKLVKGGEPYCLEIKSNGSNPLTVVTAACDASETNQRFRFQKQADGYLVSSDGVYLYWRPNGRYGLIAQESGEGDDLTSWRLRDKGEAGIPDLD